MRNRLSNSTTFRVFDNQSPLLDIDWGEIQYFTRSYSSPGHKFQHKPVPGIHGSKDDLINRFLVDYIPLNSLGTLEDFFDNRRVARYWLGWAIQY